MTIQNIHHLHKYQCTPEEWEKLGKTQKHFRIVSDDTIGQVINNKLPAEKESKPGAQVIKDKQTKQTKK